MNALLFAITGRIKEGEPKPITDAWQEEGDERYLSWQELREMVESGIFEIHSHTHTHDFSWIQAPSEEARRMVQQDIATSVQTLRDRGYAHELHLAWPWRYFRKDWDLLKIKVSIFRDFKQLDAAAGRSPALHQKIQRLRCYLCPCANGSGS